MPLQRTRITTLLFALAALVATLGSAALAYRGVRIAFEREFTHRLSQLAVLGASQVSAEDVADIGRFGEDGAGYLAMQAQMLSLRATAGLSNVSLLDTNGVVLVDVRDPEVSVGFPSALDTLARPTLAIARTGRPAVSPPWSGRAERAAVAPVRDDGRVVALVAVESKPDFGQTLLEFRRRLGLITLVSAGAIAVLAWFLVRVAGSALDLERRLSRAENLAAMGQLTATLAHEIKNPLAIIRGSAKRLGRVEPEAQRMADSVVEEVDRLSRTVSRYLQFARGVPEERGEGDVAAALLATLDLLEGEFAQRRVRLDRPIDPPAARVALDPESLKQVFLNLVLNALEASPTDGTVRVKLAAEPTMVRVTIADDGPGISGSVLARLEQPFTTTKAQGTGLGLFLARRLVRSAGGQLELANNSGQGATCRVVIPRLG